MSRCRSCGSIKVGFKPEAGTDRYCDSCDARFNEALPPRSAFKAADPVCPECGSFRLDDGFSGEIACLDCSWVGTEAIDASAYTEPAQTTLGEVRDGDD